ncbi:MAG: hypothetical protein M1834_007140 [Cirrosporium novae-zelandiae]|nr:MAG: hypothetical protein M1834_007140 [Cirrosporium novae-zelandiae]
MANYRPSVPRFMTSSTRATSDFEAKLDSTHSSSLPKEPRSTSTLGGMTPIIIPSLDSHVENSRTDTDYGDESSNYGSDFSADEELLLQDLVTSFSTPIIPATASVPLQRENIFIKSIKDDECFEKGRNSGGAGEPRTQSWSTTVLGGDCPRFSSLPPPDIIPQRPRLWKTGKRKSDSQVESSDSRQKLRAMSAEPILENVSGPAIAMGNFDTRSPIKRFRTAPKKPLSVTDLVSPAWCELQYWYNLTRFGKKPRTVEMKAGSRIHEKLEAQVHEVIPVEVQTKEDAWGLKIWNVIQGLKTLREIGITRELEVWGAVDGHLVNGIIDQLDYICPNEELEESSPSSEKQTSRKSKSKKKEKLSPLDSQKSIAEFLTSNGGTILEYPSVKQLPRKIYLTDVKTRRSNPKARSRSLPSGAAIRPTYFQLMLYRQFLCDLVSGSFSPDIIFSRFKINPELPFTDSFIAQIGSLEEIFYNAPESLSGSSIDVSSQDSMSVILTHNSLSKLWSFLEHQFSLTFPAGADSIGHVLQAEYRDQTTSEVIGSNNFRYDEDMLSNYIKDEMQWWNGERPAKGVEVEEAYKCGVCDFADECDWRKGKIEEMIEKKRMRERGRNKSTI